MVKFERYPHVNDLLIHYAHSLNRPDIEELLNTGISSKNDAELFFPFYMEDGRSN